MAVSAGRAAAFDDLVERQLRADSARVEQCKGEVKLRLAAVFTTIAAGAA